MTGFMCMLHIIGIMGGAVASGISLAQGATMKGAIFAAIAFANYFFLIRGINHLIKKRKEIRS